MAKIFFLPLASCLLPLLTFAANTGEVNITNTVPDITSAQGTGGTGNFVGWVQNFYQFALLAGVFLAVGVIAWAGLRYALAAGNPSGQSDARDQILQAFLGLVLLFGAYLVLYTVNPNLVNLRLPTLQTVVVNAPPGGRGNTGVVTAGWGTGSSFQGTGGGSGGGGATACTVCLTDAEARQALGFDATVKSGASLYGIQPTTISGVHDLKNLCSNCNIVITSGTDGVHSTNGLYSHTNGYKVDIQPNATLDNYIKSNFISIGVRSDGAPQYRAPDGAIYAREYNHWDVVMKS